MMEYFRIALVVLVVILLEVIHATLVQRIKAIKIELYNALGTTGPGYYVVGLFWVSPTYRKLLTSGQLAKELSMYPKLARLSQVELVLWYAMWLSPLLFFFDK